MNLLLFTVLFMFSFSTHALDFHKCIDADGQSHFTNLPESSLDANCSQKTDRFSVLLHRDYLNLGNEFKKYAIEENLPDENKATVETGKSPVDVILKPDKAIKPVEPSLNKAENAATNDFKSNRKVLEQLLTTNPKSIISTNPITPPDKE